ncbi:kinase-like domain-containing protein [Mycena rosella]|uniref:Kinase-like domain-containing protein n=1 Tax=Mycena rosella TaxID=1033263 RepID=A0AAD7CWM3_MYCRO|nr:kinase-like domain-containing protein [Mycena rosella]
MFGWTHDVAAGVKAKSDGILLSLPPEKSSVKNTGPQCFRSSTPPKLPSTRTSWATTSFWRDHNAWLKEHGYILRARYQPDWIAWDHTTGCVLDATRVLDGLPVLFKQKGLPSDRSSTIDFRAEFELQIIRKFSSEPLASDPKNHCVHLVEILDVPDVEKMNLIVIPLLFNWNYPRFAAIGEVVDLFSQILEGLHFMHSHNAWHGDCKINNIMMDSAPIQVSPRTLDLSRKARFRTRTQSPVRYYWIDFDHSGEHDPTNGSPLTELCYGGTHGVPEFAFQDRMCDPFAVDVWCLGNMIREYFTQVGFRGHTQDGGLQFMYKLVADMTHEDPTKRPNMDDVVHRFTKIKASLSQWKLRSRFAEEAENAFVGIYRTTAHWTHQLRFAIKHA